MKFVRTEKLKRGMRLAKPIYNRDGILLYERNSRLTEQGIVAISNFGLIGIYTLESGEALPPMSQDDIEFERFQSVGIFAVKDEIDTLTKKGRAADLDALTDSLLMTFGALNRKINFVQNLRSKEDYIAKHTLNVAILCALMSEAMKWKEDRKKLLIYAALLHDIGKVEMPSKLIGTEDYLADEEHSALRVYQDKSLVLIEKFYPSQPLIKWTVMQAAKMMSDFYKDKNRNTDAVPEEAKVLAAAEFYDTMTAMKSINRTVSDIAALRCMIELERFFGEKTVNALINSINFLAEGCCVELSNGETGVVLARNGHDILKPRVLSFKTNDVIELDQETGKGMNRIEIRDAMKTLDNRYVMDWDSAKNYFDALKTQENEG